jgi:antitoxin component of MazEF toxin-antitoxin module
MPKSLNDTTSFHANVLIIGNSLGIIIPSNILKFEGLDKGDKVKIWIRKE